ncbi:MAG: hypothetical protein IT370_23455 [Deltaproteobacteria bacterium]|nr:hypothetical protein [Deltaproteobacteria bacterium]
MALGERIIVVGRVGGKADAEGFVLVRARLKVGKRIHNEQREQAFTLALVNSERRLEVEADADALAGELRLERTGSWGKLQDDRLAKLFTSHAPGDHVEVALSGHFVCPGDLLAISCEVTDERAPEAGYREAVPTRVRALRIAVGADEAAARSALDVAEATQARAARAAATPKAAAPARPKPPPSKRTAPYGDWPVIVLGLAAVAIMAGHLFEAGPDARGRVAPWRISAIAFAVLLGLHALAIWATQYPRGVHGARASKGKGDGKRKGGPPPRFPTAFGGTGIPVLVALFVLPLAGAVREAAIVRLAFLPIAAEAALIALVLLVSRYDEWRFLGLTSGTPVAAPQEGRFAAHEGVITSSGVALGMQTTFTRHSESYTRMVSDSNGNQVAQESTRHWWTSNPSPMRSPRFTLTTPSGDLLVETDGADYHTLTVSWDERTVSSKLVLRHQLRKDDAARVIGRPVREGEQWLLRAGGEESLLVIGGGKPPLGPRLWAARLRYLGWPALFLAIAAGCLLLVQHWSWLGYPRSP